MSGHMGDTFPDPRGRRSDALEGDESRARTPSLRSGPRERPVDDDRTLSAVPHQPEHRLQVARSIPAGGTARARGPQPRAALLAAPDPGRRRRAGPRGTHPLRLGRPQDPETPAHPRPAACLACPQHHLRYSGPPRPRAPSPPPPPLEAPRRSEEHTSELQSQSNIVCRLLLEKKNKTLIAAPPNTKNQTAGKQ